MATSEDTLPSKVPTSTATVLRIEGIVFLVLAVVLYQALGGGWLWFALLFLTPDVCMLGYAKNPQLGARLYNAAHTYITPALFGAVWWATGDLWMGRIALIWMAHIGFDRVLGYGLKDPTGFKHTHLQRV